MVREDYPITFAYHVGHVLLHEVQVRCCGWVWASLHAVVLPLLGPCRRGAPDGCPWDRSWCRYAAAECGREPTCSSRHARCRACVTKRDQLHPDAMNWEVNLDTNLPSSSDLGSSIYGSSGAAPSKSSGLWGGARLHRLANLSGASRRGCRSRRCRGVVGCRDGRRWRREVLSNECGHQPSLRGAQVAMSSCPLTVGITCAA